LLNRQSYLSHSVTLGFAKANRMTIKHEPILVKGRSLGIAVLTVAQLLIGVIHLLFGFWLLSSENSLLHATVTYDIYTVAFGALVLFFGWLIWQGKYSGWICTIAVSVFVSVADTLTLANLPSIPGIPTFAAPTEIGYSIIIVIFLLQPNVRRKFGV
jgi:hypothetical protein